MSGHEDETLAEDELASIIFDASLNNPRTDWLRPTARAVLEWVAARDARVAATARANALAPVLALLAEWDAWDGSRDGFATSPRVRDALRAATEDPS